MKTKKNETIVVGSVTRMLTSIINNDLKGIKRNQAANFNKHPEIFTNENISTYEKEMNEISGDPLSAANLFIDVYNLDVSEKDLTLAFSYVCPDLKALKNEMAAYVISFPESDFIKNFALACTTYNKLIDNGSLRKYVNENILDNYIASNYSYYMEEFTERLNINKTSVNAAIKNIDTSYPNLVDSYNEKINMDAQKRFVLAYKSFDLLIKCIESGKNVNGEPFTILDFYSIFPLYYFKYFFADNDFLEDRGIKFERNSTYYGKIKSILLGMKLKYNVILDYMSVNNLNQTINFERIEFEKKINTKLSIGNISIPKCVIENTLNYLDSNNLPLLDATFSYVAIEAVNGNIDLSSYEYYVSEKITPLKSIKAKRK